MSAEFLKLFYQILHVILSTFSFLPSLFPPPPHFPPILEESYLLYTLLSSQLFLITDFFSCSLLKLTPTLKLSQIAGFEELTCYHC